MGAVAVVETPLARLLLLGARTLLDALHSRLAARGWPAVGQGYGFVLLGVRSEAMTVTQIAALLGVTKQAASKVVAQMKREGLVRTSAHPADSRAVLVAITPHGSEFLAAVEEIYAELESEWAARIGQERLETMRADLTSLLAADGQLPPIRPVV